MFTKEIVTTEHTTRFTITRDVEGWDVREERDSALVRQSHYADWHRVERAMQSFDLAQSPQASPDKS